MENHIRRILEAALRSPSGDNCQPFRFKIINSTTIEIFHLNKVAQHFLNANNFASLLALGTVIESMFIEARGLGFIPAVKISDQVGSSQDGVWATIELTKTSMPLAENLIGAFESRWTNRAAYQEEMLSAEVIQKCKTQATLGSTEIEVSYGKPVDTDFIEYLQQTEMTVWDHKTAANDLLKTFRFPNNKNPTIYDDGLSSYELGINVFQMLMMRVLYRFPWMLSVFYFFGFSAVSHSLTKKNYLQSGGLLTLSASMNKDPQLAAVECGRSAMRVWMYLNQNGYVVQPVTSGSLLSFQNQNQTLSSPIKPAYKEIFNRGSQIWKKYFNTPESFHVVWALRVGKPIQILQRHRSKRWKLEDMILPIDT